MKLLYVYSEQLNLGDINFERTIFYWNSIALQCISLCRTVKGISLMYTYDTER